MLKRWPMVTQQGGVHDKYLDNYHNEFTFGFKRRTSKSRELQFYRLVEQAVKIVTAQTEKPDTRMRKNYGGGIRRNPHHEQSTIP